MKIHSDNFKNQIKLKGKEIDSRILYNMTGLGKDNLNSVTPSFQGTILKSVMKQLDIDTNIDIPLNTILRYEFGLKVGGEYEYINFGNYIVYKSEKQEDTRSYKLTCYDKMLYTMVEYKGLQHGEFPMSIRDYINNLCLDCGLEFKNSNDEFANYDKILEEDLYFELGYTYRDIFDELSQVTASTICLDEDDKVEIRYITETNDIIDEEFLKDVNVNFGEKFGAVNTIVLSRSGGSDNIYYPEELPENPYELKISDNQIMNFNNRSEYLPAIYEKLNGLEFYINDFTSTGICYYDLCDRYSVKVGDKVYSCVMFNDEINVTQGLQEIIYTELPEETETDYTKADKTDRKINGVSLIVDKQQNQINALANQIVEVSNSVTGIGKVNIENGNKGGLYTLSIKGNISLLYPNEPTFGANATKSGTYKSGIAKSSSHVKYSNGLFPSETLTIPTMELKISQENNKSVIYDLPINYLRSHGNVYDEFRCVNGNMTIIRRVGLDTNGNKYILKNEIIENLGYMDINIPEGNSTIEMLYFDNVIFGVTYLLANKYTDVFATKVELQSEINVRNDEIELLTKGKVGDDEIVAKINTAIRDGQGVINLTGNQVTIESDEFQLNAEGNINATAGKIAGLTINHNGLENSSTRTYNFTENDLNELTSIISSSTPPTEYEINNYDVNGDRVLNILDLLIIRKMVYGDLSQTIESLFEVNSDDPTSLLSIKDTVGGNTNVSLGYKGGYIKSLGVEQLSARNEEKEATLDATTLRFWDYNSSDGTTITSGEVASPIITQTSLEIRKKDFELLENALEIINKTDIYKYHLKNEDETTKKHIGFVIGENFNYSKDITNDKNSGVDLYSMIAVSYKAIKEQQELIEKLQRKIALLEDNKSNDIIEEESENNGEN